MSRHTLAWKRTFHAASKDATQPPPDIVFDDVRRRLGACGKTSAWGRDARLDAAIKERLAQL